MSCKYIFSRHNYNLSGSAAKLQSITQTVVKLNL